ncbi:YchJ family metal-binding protein [Breoghania sp. L-A4]|uniref:YchJ family protein n=1 Tax=Breoghania sp. L-A4 TaxID=2304600 RepID=UPI000E35F2A6|nr:YchJ family metal-binding protein [Breoghania sp. L-A4]AXS42293.1 zinc chelation protein SecC [Breoghania sp. L-A4]
MTQCPCRSGETFDACCGRFLSRAELPETAEQLMRSRYAAFVRRDIAYLKETLWPKFQKTLDTAGLAAWAEQKQWVGLEILKTGAGGPADKLGMVLFVARSLEGGEIREHREYSLFRKKNKRWYYVGAEKDVMLPG